MTNKCEKPNSKLEEILDFGRYFLRFLEKNKIALVLFFIAIVIWSINISAERIGQLINMIK